MKLDDLARKRVAVWGLGREGAGIVRLLRARGQEPRLVDDDPTGAGVAGLAAGDPRPPSPPMEMEWKS